MIPANELRLDNYVLFKKLGRGKGKIGQILPGDFGRVRCDDPENSEYHPIPLTPEWLERCGFTPVIDENIDNARYSIQVGNNLYINYYVRSGSWCVEPENWTNEQMCWLQPKHLHQLQNLYFAHTGEELKIKIP